MQIKNAVILAGGRGTRLSEQTHEIPKPLVQIGGMPILAHLINHLASQGIENIVVAGGYKVNLIKEYFMSDDYKYQGSITITEDGVACDKNVLPHGLKSLVIADTGANTNTAQRIKRGAAYLPNEDGFFVAYGDNVSDVDLSEVEAQLTDDRLAVLTAVRYQERFGILHIDGEQTVTNFAEKSMSVNEFINGGFIACRPEVIDLILDEDGDFSGDTLPRMQEMGKLGAHVHEGFWAAMDTQRDYLELNKLYEEKPELFVR